MIELEKNLPMAFVFYGQDSLVENNKRYDEIGIFPSKFHLFKTFRKTCSESRGDYICQQIITLILWKKTIWKFHGMIIPVMTVIH